MRNFFQRVEENDDNYHLAQVKVKDLEDTLRRRRLEALYIDSIARVEQFRKDSISKFQKEIEELEKFKNRLIQEIKGVQTFNGSEYRNEVTSIQIEMALFVVWADLAEEAIDHTDSEINKLGDKLNSKLIHLQRRELPMLRKAYGDILKKKLWTEDIEVHTKGSSHSTIEFTGGLFASNKNIQATQETLREMFTLLRFRRVNYKWYKYDDEYTYYSLNPESDGTIVKL